MRRSQQGKGLQIPHKIRVELDQQDLSHNDRRSRTGTSLAAQRKQRRKQARSTKSQNPANRSRPNAQKLQVAASKTQRSLDTSKPAHEAKRPSKTSNVTDPERPVRLAAESTDSATMSDSSHADPIPRGVQKRLAEDDAEIAALEKKLGKRRKKNGNRDEAGLGDILGDLGGSEDEEGAEISGGTRKAQLDSEAADWLREKRLKHLKTSSQSEPTATRKKLGEKIVNEGDDSEEGGLLLFEASDSEESEDEGLKNVEAVPVRVRENPYVAPATESTQKYVPPSKRITADSEAVRLSGLRRQIKGLLNRLSTESLLGIIKQVQDLYQKYPRHDVSSTAVDLLATILCDSTTLNDTFIILHTGFIAGLYETLGTDFGAMVVQRFVEDYDRYKQSKEEGVGKQLLNIVNVLSELYTFQVTGNGLLYDLVRELTSSLSETSTELLLKIVRNSGQQLRREDPSALKDVVVLLHESAEVLGESNLSVRTKFMIETINDLKNNRMKAGKAISEVKSEHTIRMKKLLGSMHTSKSFTAKATEPLRIGLNDIRNSDLRGKWWLTGASYRDELQAQRPVAQSNDAPKESPIARVMKSKSLLDEGDGDTAGLADFAAMGKALGMNTDLRQAIFINIMSAAGVEDGHTRLVKMGLQRRKLPDIVQVLVRCLTLEQSYNPYYMQLATKLCIEREIRKALWTPLLQALAGMEGEADEMADEEDEEDGEGNASLWWQEARAKYNAARFYGALIAQGTVNLAVLKNRNLMRPPRASRGFLELLFVSMLVALGKDNDTGLERVFAQLATKDNVGALVRALTVFFQKILAKTTLVGKAERKVVQWGCDASVRILQRLAERQPY